MAKIITRTRKIIANNIIFYRISNGYSQENLAELLGTSSTYVSELEHHKRNISCDYLDKLANVFKIEPHELLVDRSPVEIRRIKKRKR